MPKPSAYKGKRLRPLLASAAENAASAEKAAADALTPDWDDIQNKPTTFPSSDSSSSGSTVMIDFGGGETEEPFLMPGTPGTPGAVGTPGAAGTIGRDGAVVVALDGEDGEDGMPLPGPQGPTGLTGTAGATGATGQQGPIGFALDGNDGEDGGTDTGTSRHSGNGRNGRYSGRDRRSRLNRCPWF
jgi:hypothetical protein